MEIILKTLSGVQPTDAIDKKDIVRSYDFPDSPRQEALGCYIEGHVITIVDGMYYVVGVDRVMWEGVEQDERSEHERLVNAPCNGMRRLDGGTTHGVFRVLYTTSDGDRYIRPELEAIISKYDSSLTVEQLITRLDGIHPSTLFDECGANAHFDSDPNEHGRCPGCGCVMPADHVTRAVLARLIRTSEQLGLYEEIEAPMQPTR